MSVDDAIVNVLTGQVVSSGFNPHDLLIPSKSLYPSDQRPKFDSLSLGGRGMGCFYAYLCQICDGLFGLKSWGEFNRLLLY